MRGFAFSHLWRERAMCRPWNAAIRVSWARRESRLRACWKKLFEQRKRDREREWERMRRKATCLVWFWNVANWIESYVLGKKRTEPWTRGNLALKPCAGHDLWNDAIGTESHEPGGNLTLGHQWKQREPCAGQDSWNDGIKTESHEPGGNLALGHPWKEREGEKEREREQSRERERERGRVKHQLWT